MIDFTPLPLRQKPASGLRDFLIALGIMLTLLGYMLFVMFVLKIDDPTVGVALPNFVATVVAFAVFGWAIYVMIQKIRRQQIVMQSFARVNHFTFDKPAGWKTNEQYLPKSASFIPTRTKMLYLVAGETDNGSFELYALHGEKAFVYRGPGGVRQMQYRTVIRVPRVLNEKTNDEFSIEHQGGYSYIVYHGNIYDRENMQKMFEFMATS
jgi:hypothetical protein